MHEIKSEDGGNTLIVLREEQLPSETFAFAFLKFDSDPKVHL